MRAGSRAFVAGLVGVAATLIGLAAPAQAAACTRGTGVTVVVGSSVKCHVGGGGNTADVSFGAVGHKLTYASRSPGFVCRVNDSPASDPCVNTSPADAYWGFFVSDGTSGKWTYAKLGVRSQSVKKGGWVAFVFQSSNSKTYPSMTPLGPTPPKPKPTATAKPTTTKPTTPKPSASSSATPSSKAAKQKSDEQKDDGATPTTPSSSTSAGGDTSDAAQTSDVQSTAAAAEDDNSSTTLLWVAGVLALAMVVAGVVAARARMRS